MVENDDLIHYGYLNLDTNEFVPEYSDLVKQIGWGGVFRVILNDEYGQVLYAGSKQHFSESEALLTCRRIKEEQKSG